MVDKNFCMSSFLSFRFVEDENISFYEGIPHENIKKNSNITKCYDFNDIDLAFKKFFDENVDEKTGILLSGGMDSAILAAYMPKGTNAYTFKSNAPNAVSEIEQAKKYVLKQELNHKIVEINWEDFDNYGPILMKQKGAPIHSIEVQIYKAALQAKRDGLDKIIVGESADLVFGGMDKLLSKDWGFEEFIERYSFVKPEEVLVNPISMIDTFERFKINENKIDFQEFLQVIFSKESSSSYYNAFKTANVQYFDPFGDLEMAHPLDLDRVRKGESKYMVRELFAKYFPEIEIPEKIPMPRAVDYWLKDWEGPTREEFLPNCVETLTGDQKWLVYSLEMFLNLHEKGER